MTGDADQLRVARTAFETVAASGVVTIPHDRQLARMLDTGAFAFGSLARATRVGARSLTLALLEHVR